MHIVGSPTHAFNGTLVSNDPYKLSSWVFYEPQNGQQIELGEAPYEFPIEITLKTVIVEDWGHSPSVLIKFTDENTDGILRLIVKWKDKV